MHTFNTNIHAYFFMAKYALPHMKEGDAIINTSSVTAYVGTGPGVDYISTKGAITAFTRALSNEQVRKGIRVNAVAAGPVWTPLITSTMDKESIDWLISMSGGDARQMLAMVENTQSLYGKITIDNLTQTLQSKFLRYDRAGEEHYNTISAFIKSMRASQPDAALYYMSRMIASGEDPVFVFSELLKRKEESKK